MEYADIEEMGFEDEILNDIEDGDLEEIQSGDGAISGNEEEVSGEVEEKGVSVYRSTHYGHEHKTDAGVHAGHKDEEGDVCGIDHEHRYGHEVEPEHEHSDLEHCHEEDSEHENDEADLYRAASEEEYQDQREEDDEDELYP